MLTGPHWDEIRAYVAWSYQNQETPDAMEFIKRQQRFWSALEAIAADSSEARADREWAQEILDEIAEQVRKEGAASLKRLAEIADDPAANPEARAAAQAALEIYLVQLRSVVNDPQTPEEVRQHTKEALRRFMAS